MRNRWRVILTTTVFAALASGCASTYVSPPTGPATAEIEMSFLGHSLRPSKYASIFEEPLACRTWQRIELDKSPAAKIVVPARPTTLQLVSVGTQMGYQTISGQRCDLIGTFEPKAGQKYRISHLDFPEGCRLQMTMDVDGVQRDVTASLVKRVVLPINKIDMREAKPRLCADTYEPVQ